MAGSDFMDWYYARAMDIEAMNLSPADAKAFVALARSAFDAGRRVRPVLATPKLEATRAAHRS